MKRALSNNDSIEMYQRCQALKIYKNEIKKKEKTLLKECDDFCIKIINLYKSPWNPTEKNNSIIDWCNANNLKNLGSKQKAILKYLQRQYLNAVDRGTKIVCFPQYKYLAARLNCTPKQVSNILRSLEKKGLIFRLKWLYQRRNRIAILPSIPHVSEFFTKKHPDLMEFCTRTLSPHELFSKTNNSHNLQLSIYLYTNILIFNNIININKIKEYSIKDEVLTFLRNSHSSNDELNLLDFFGQPQIDFKPSALEYNLERRRTLMPIIKQKFENKHLESKNIELLESTKTALKEHDFDFMKIPEENRYDIVSYLDQKYGIDFNRMYKTSSHSRKFTPWYYHTLVTSRRRLMLLLYKGIRLQFEYAIPVISFWNINVTNYRETWGKDLTRLQMLKKDSDLMSFQKAVIAITWILYTKYAGNKKTIFQAIDRLMGIRPYDAPFQKPSTTKLTLESYLHNFYDSSNIDALLTNNEMALVEYYSYKNYREDIQKTYPIVKKAIIKTFENENQGRIYCKKNIPGIVGFINRITSSILQKHVNTGGLKFFAPNPIVDRPPLVNLFINFLEEQIRPKEKYQTGIIKSLNDPVNLELFANYVVRNELGISDFWKTNKQLKKKIKEGDEKIEPEKEKIKSEFFV